MTDLVINIVLKVYYPKDVPCLDIILVCGLLNRNVTESGSVCVEGITSIHVSGCRTNMATTNHALNQSAQLSSEFQMSCFMLRSFLPYLRFPPA